MKNKFFLFSNLLALGIVLLHLTACKNESAAAPKKETLRLATSADNPPFEFHLTTLNQITGFDIELAYALAEVLDVNIEIQDMDFSSIIPALLSGRADFAMATISITDERKKNVSFSEVYYTAQPASVSLKNHYFSHPKNFEDRSIGVQLGSSYEQMMKKIAQEVKNVHLIPLNKLGELIQEIKAGRIDAAVIDIAPAKAYVKNNKDLQTKVIEGYQESYAIAFPRNSVWTKKFNDALKILREKGKLAELESKWFINNLS
jgi:ABC-type amino acid transport substrate-binding protein